MVTSTSRWWVLLCLPLVACEASPAGPEEERGASMGPVEPALARRNSAACPNRCSYPLEIGDGTAFAVELFEEASIFGVGDSGRTPFYWSLKSGVREVTVSPPHDPAEARYLAANDWGQLAGLLDDRAVAWNADGSRHDLRTDDGTRVEGWTRDVNVKSVFVGNGRPAGTFEPTRAFRYHYADGFDWITSAEGVAYDVSDAGEVVGEYRAEDDSPHAFVWSSSTGLRDLGLGRARAISETGYIVGTLLASGGPIQGWIRGPGGELTYLKPGWHPVAVNRWGEVVLQGQSNSCELAVWYKGYGLLRVDIPFADPSGCSVAGINSWGDLLGTVSVPDGTSTRHGPGSTQHIVVWTWSGNQHRYIE